MPKAYDLIGQRFTWLTVLERVKREGDKVRWKCRCDCGNILTPLTQSLMVGDTKSCGCWVIANNTKHGDWKTKFYAVWRSLKERCSNPKHKHYKDYGGRGITVCEEWKEDYLNFKRDMFESYKPGLTIDRIDNNKGYCKDNCRWATHTTQHRNTRSNRLITTSYGTLTIPETAELEGMSLELLHGRLRRGVSGDDLLKPAQDSKFKPHKNKG